MKKDNIICIPSIVDWCGCNVREPVITNVLIEHALHKRSE